MPASATAAAVRPLRITPAMDLEIVHELPGRIRFRIESALPANVVHGVIARGLAQRIARFELTYSRHSRRFLVTGAPDAPLGDALRDAATAPAPPSEEWPLLAGLGDGHANDTARVAVGIVLPKVTRFLLMRWLTPPWLAPLTTAHAVWPYLRDGVKDLLRGDLSVSVLDAAAITASLAMRDLPTASTIAFLLDLGESLEEWTKERARQNLADLYRGAEEPAWLVRDGVEVQVPARQLEAGDRVVVRMGSRIPVDGVVQLGEALVNQSAMTGETQAAPKRPGLSVFAGTVVEEGQLVIEARRVGDETRFANIARIIEGSAANQSEVASEVGLLGRRAVPYTFLASGLVLLLTRNWIRAASVLVVDFSCALKLATPLAIKSAMVEAASHGSLIKGGKHLETLARADVIVFDKTGTLTEARPRVAGVYPLNGFSREFVLRNAACLEEHFPHPVARAIVDQAVREKLDHEERHSEVEYVLAHGIVSTLDGQRVMVGSRHFVCDHAGVDPSPADELVRVATAEGCGVLYFVVGDEVAGVIAIEDPLLPEARQVMSALREIGFKRLVLLTGDHQRAAATVARELGLTEVHAEVLPDEKTAVIERLRAEGHVVAMIGDGINDSAALAVADVGISMSHGADIAREVADVLLLDSRLDALPDAVLVSRRALTRVRRTFKFSVGANAAFMGLGVFGLAPASLLALLHNASTVASCVWSLKPLLPRQRRPPASS